MGYNTRLVEVFGNLEKLCNELYNDVHGVTLYINDMISKSYMASAKVSNWNYDLQFLKTVRDKRNKLSHGEVSFDTPYATEDDIAFVIEFKARIMSCSDPLALYRKAIAPQPRTKTQQNYTVQKEETQYYSNNPKASRQPLGCAVFLIGAVAITALIIALIITTIS